VGFHLFPGVEAIRAQPPGDQKRTLGFGELPFENGAAPEERLAKELLAARVEAIEGDQDGRGEELLRRPAARPEIPEMGDEVLVEDRDLGVGTRLGARSRATASATSANCFVRSFRFLEMSRTRPSCL